MRRKRLGDAGDDEMPAVLDPALVGTYPAVAGAGGGFVWDAVLEYRVWGHDSEKNEDFYCAFASYGEALAYRLRTPDATGEPLALVLQEEYLEEESAGVYKHIREQRIAEWPVEFLARPRRTSRTIPDFLSPAAPHNRLDILRGQT
jgi:hypothetical protein